jgi:N,N-dimethylformamidase
MRSGVYALVIRCGEHEDNIPFFVCPPKGKRQADLCVVMPTFTYVIYSNNARYDFGPELEKRMVDWKAYPWNPARHPEYGLSSYNWHSDGSGICHVSSLRPMLSVRCGYLSLLIPGCGSGLRHFQADTHLLAWLEHQGIDYDIVTDQELNDDGAAALTPYKAVFTTTHPEYHTAASLDAYAGYRAAGGRLAYLGGNGFYWRVALHAQAPGAIEIRRGEGGIRAWASETGEYHNAFDGAYGGLWRRSGRPPQALAGVGFSGQGTFVGSHYRRTAAASDPRVSWIFDGIDDEILGDFGLSGGGAAGYELDRVDYALGSPDNIVVVARSEKHTETYVAVPEELLTHVSTITGEPPKDLIRAEMAYFETPSGGAVFSTGSITFCGSLPSHNFDNNVSRLMLNVARRFLA